ncbi:aminotransferase class I/II-fold pyridoxal phosphate-dependent enzyme [Neisseriaceae bacterium TC5R-5]|nr:aminotransferase class I/II-fold pyridoxal phosphate-dependent enzyme [Neisseriaceae bacterium TC5R-5]
MAKFADHLIHHTIINPFPGMTRLEAVLGHPLSVRVSSNESMAEPLSPLAARFGSEIAELARLYPDPYAFELRQRIADRYDVMGEEVLFDSGADSLILLALRLFCNVGDTVVCSAGTYPTFRYFAQGAGVNLAEVPYQQEGSLLRADLAAMVELAQRSQAKLLYLANPDNPTGHYWGAQDIFNLREQLPADTWLLLDEAYVDFCVAAQDKPPQGILPNTLRVRTLSKAYALAGLRVGYALAPAYVVNKADQIRPQFGLSSFAQLAAQTVLDDRHFSLQLIMATIAMRQQLSVKLMTRGLNVLPSSTNFVAVSYESSERSLAIQQALWDAGVAVHCPPHPAVRHLLRITADPQALQDKVIDILARR